MQDYLDRIERITRDLNVLYSMIETAGQKSLVDIGGGIRQIKSLLEKADDLASKRIKALDLPVAHGSTWVVVREIGKRETLDTKALRAELPRDYWGAYLKATEVSSLRYAHKGA